MRTAFGLVLVLTACAAPSSLAPYAASGAAAPATTGSRFLYVSDFQSSVVNVYSVPSLQFVRKLKGFFEPQGECTNAAGDIWIVDTGYHQIDEYAPGAAKPIAALGDYLGYPASCAVNPVNGDLAVTNEFAASGPAQVLIYRHASGTPRAFRDKDQEDDGFAGYDDKGNLYVAGETLKHTYLLSQLRAGAKALSGMTLSGATIHDAGVVLWNNGELILGDQACRGGKSSCLYVATVSGGTAVVKATIVLGSSCDVVQVALYDGALYGGNGDCAKHSGTVDRWSYPKGERERAAGVVHEPIGAAITGPPTGRL